MPVPGLRDLFRNVADVRFPNSAAFGADWVGADGLLEAIGVVRQLKPIKTKLEGRRLREVGSRLRDGAAMTWHYGHDWEVLGLSQVLEELSRDEPDVRVSRSRRLWNALRERWIASHDDSVGCWEGRYHWSYSHSHRDKGFDAEFVEALRDTAWVADERGDLEKPSGVVFSGLGWTEEPALEQKLGFLSDDDKRKWEQREMLDVLEDWGVRTPDELRSRWASMPDVPTPDQVPTVTLSEVAEWWADAKVEQRRRYEEMAFPEVLDIASLAGEDRVGWFTFFGLACFRSYGRTTEAQHRGFVDRGVREGWWTELAESRPPGNAAAWLDRLQAWSSADQQSEVFGMWRGSFVALYTVARWLDRYARLMLKLPDIIADKDGRVSLRELMNPAHSPAVRRLGVDAAPLARTLGIGVNWMIRELLRAGVYRRGVMAPYAWMSSRRVRDFLVRAGGPTLDEPAPDHSPQIHEFVVKELGSEAAEFDGDYDLPLQLRTDHGWR